MKKEKKETPEQKEAAIKKLLAEIEAAKLLRAERRNVPRGEKASWVIAFNTSNDIIYFEGTEVQAENKRRSEAYTRKCKGIKRFALDKEIELKIAIRGINPMESKFTKCSTTPVNWKVEMLKSNPTATEADFNKSLRKADVILAQHAQRSRTHLELKAKNLKETAIIAAARRAESIKLAKENIAKLNKSNTENIINSSNNTSLVKNKKKSTIITKKTKNA